MHGEQGSASTACWVSRWTPRPALVRFADLHICEGTAGSHCLRKLVQCPSRRSVSGRFAVLGREPKAQGSAILRSGRRHARLAGRLHRRSDAADSHRYATQDRERLLVGLEQPVMVDGTCSPVRPLTATDGLFIRLMVSINDPGHVRDGGRGQGPKVRTSSDYTAIDFHSSRS